MEHHIVNYYLVLILLNLLAAASIYEAKVIFIEEPHDIVAYEGEDAFMHCDYSGVSSIPTWMITTSNGTQIITSSAELPQSHFYNGSGIVIRKVDRIQNMTSYRCILFVASDDFQQIKNYTSTAGMLKVIPSPHMEIYYQVLSTLTILVVAFVIFGICFGGNNQFFSKFEFFARNEIEKHTNNKQINFNIK